MAGDPLAMTQEDIEAALREVQQSLLIPRIISILHISVSPSACFSVTPFRLPSLTMLL